MFATPHSQHGAQVERAAAAGKHVFMEKLFTLDVKSAEAALDAVAWARVVLAVTYPCRFHPAMIELKTRVADGRLGTVSHCERAQTSPTGLSMDPNYWRSDPQEAPAGAMIAAGVHNLDAMIYLFGRIDEVYCVSLRRLMPRLEDTTTILLGLANGISATLYCSLVTAPSYRFAVYVTEGSVELATSNLEFRITRFRRRRPGRMPHLRPKSSSTRASMHSPPSSKGCRRDQRRTTLPDHRRRDIAPRCRFRGDRRLGRPPSAGQGRPQLAV